MWGMEFKKCVAFKNHIFLSRLDSLDILMYIVYSTFYLLLLKILSICVVKD